MPYKLQSRITHAFCRYGRFCASHSFVLLICSISAFLVLCRPVFRMSLSRISFDSRVTTSHDLDDISHPLAGFVVQLVVRRKLSNMPFSPEDVLDINRKLFNAVNRSSRFTGDADIMPIGCKTLVEVVGECSNSPYKPDCVAIYAADLSLAEIENAMAERGRSALQRLFRAAVKNTPNLLDTVLEIVFDSHKQYTGEDVSKRQFSFVLLLHDKPGTGYLRGLCEILSNDFEVSHCNAAFSNGEYVSINYHTTTYKRFMFSVPVSYSLLVLYVYFTVSKISMVTSKWGLALSAITTVFMSLVGAAGVCVRFRLTPTVWVTEYFPYLALMVGLENSLCITRSVVSMPVRLDPVDRLAYGLSTEAWSLIKNFIVHVCILVVGYFTFVPDIQEFCIFGLIGYFVDFFMQLFFYCPCLYFDLRRVNPEMLEEISRQQLAMQPVSLQHYPKGSCPFSEAFPRLTDLRSRLTRFFLADPGRLQRYRSESVLTDAGVMSPDSPGPAYRRHRRTHSHAGHRGTRTLSTETVPQNFAVSRRFRLMQYWTSNRLLTKFLTILITCWIVWLAIFVHKLEELNEVARRFEAPPDGPNGGSDFEPHDVDLREDSGESWAQLYNIMGWGLSGKALILAPFLYLDVSVAKNGENMAGTGGESVSGWAPALLSVVGLLCLLFGFYRRNRPDHVMKTQARKPIRKRTGSREIVDSFPTVFKGHEWPIEAVAMDASGAVAVSCSMSRILVWDTCTGDCLRNLKWPGRTGTFETHSTFAQEISIWAAALWNQILAVSYSDGVICVWNIVTGQPLCSFDPSKMQDKRSVKGACILRWQSAQVLVAVRPPGSLEFLEFDPSETRITLKRRLTAHQHNINGIELWERLVYTLSDDMTIRCFDATTCQAVSTFYAHVDSVVCLVLDQDFMCSSDLNGLICAWSRSDGTLLYSIAGIAPPVSLCLSKDFLIGKSAGGVLYLWDRQSGTVRSTIKLQGSNWGEEMWKSCFIPLKTLLLSDEYLVLDWGGKLHLWDLNHKYLLRTVELESNNALNSITHLLKIDNSSVLCILDKFVYRVNFPVIQIK